MPLLRNRIDGGEPEVREELCHTRRLLPRLCLEPRPIAGETPIWTKGAKWRPHQLGDPDIQVWELNSSPSGGASERIMASFSKEINRAKGRARRRRTTGKVSQRLDGDF